MGYPMTWQRLVARNSLQGNYGWAKDANPKNEVIAGDMRRVEFDSRDPLHLAHYAKVAGITQEQALAVLNDFFGPDAPYIPGATWQTNYVAPKDEEAKP